MKNTILTRVGLFILLVIGCSGYINAQESGKSQSLQFIYIDHESTTPVNKLCNKIKDLRDDVIESGDGLIIYLSNGDNTMVSFTNLPDPTETYIGDDRFDDIIGALQETYSHEVNPSQDLRKICAIMELVGLNDANMRLGFNTVTMDFYLGPTFWNLNDNELLISKLYFALDIPELQKGDLILNLYKPRESTLDYANNMPFGIKNIDGINQKIRLKDF